MDRSRVSLAPRSNMFKVDMTIAEELLQPVSRQNSSLGKQLPVTFPEEAIGGDENPEFKLPKMSSLVVVLVTNFLMQVSISTRFPI